MKKNGMFFSLIVFVAVIATSTSHAQTVVEPGDGTLSAAVAAANDGDVLVLKSGGEYTESNPGLLPIKIYDKSLTIMAEDAYTIRPILRFPAVASGAGNDAPNAFELKNCSLVFEGLEVDGGMADTTQFLPLYEVFSYSPEIGNTVKLLKIVDCYFHDLHWPLGYVVGGGGGYDGLFVGTDTCIVDNSLFYKAPKTISFQYTLCTYLEVTNNTFWHGTRQIIRAEDRGNGNDPVILIDHNTFYSNAQKAVQIRLGAAENQGITITNNIFAKLEKTYGDAFAGALREAVEIRTATNSLVANNCAYLTKGFSVEDTTDLKDNLFIDPKFATDPGDYPGPDADFTLASDSPVLGKATDGKAMGDPRWDPTAVAVERADFATQPAEFQLFQNYPNPFNPSTSISFSIARPNWTTLTIYNSIGQTIATLVDRKLAAGNYSFHFDASGLPSGFYFYSLKSGSFCAERKMLLLK